MRKKYIFRFVFHELNDGYSAKGQKIIFTYNSFEEALKEAKFYLDLFFGYIWRKLNAGPEPSNTCEEIMQEMLKIADEFALLPNETNFDFYEYAKSRDNYYKFEKTMSDLNYL